MSDAIRFSDVFFTASTVCYLRIALNKSVREKDWRVASQAFERMRLRACI